MGSGKISNQTRMRSKGKSARTQQSLNRVVEKPNHASVRNNPYWKDFDYNHYMLSRKDDVARDYVGSMIETRENHLEKLKKDKQDVIKNKEELFPIGDSMPQSMRERRERMRSREDEKIKRIDEAINVTEKDVDWLKYHKSTMK